MHCDQVYCEVIFIFWSILFDGKVSNFLFFGKTTQGWLIKKPQDYRISKGRIILFCTNQNILHCCISDIHTIQLFVDYSTAYTVYGKALEAADCYAYCLSDI